MRLARVRTHDLEDTDEASLPTSYRRLRRELLAVEAAELERMHRAGAVSEGTRRRIQRILDLEQAGLHDDT